jgi:hypothetical protein
MALLDLFPDHLEDMVEAHLIIQELKQDGFDFNSLTDISFRNDVQLKVFYQNNFENLNSKIDSLNEKYDLDLFNKFNIEELIYILTSIEEYKQEVKKDGINDSLFIKSPESAYFKGMEDAERIRDIIPLCSENKNNLSTGKITDMAYLLNDGNYLISIQTINIHEGFNKTYLNFRNLDDLENIERGLNSLNEEYSLKLKRENKKIDFHGSEERCPVITYKSKAKNIDLIKIFKDESKKSFEINVELNSLEDYFVSRKVLQTFYGN